MKFFAPSFPNDDSFFCRFFIEVGGYKDAAGRHFHEVDFRAEEQPDSFKVCPFHDSRKGYLMNFSALKQIMSEWQEIKQGLAFFSALYPADRPEDTDMGRAWRITLATMFAPVYLMHRQDASYTNGTLPTKVSGLFKIMLDVPTTIDLILLGGSQAGLTGNDAMVAIRNFADTQKILLNTDYACAGSPKLMDDINSAMFVIGNNEKAGHEAWESLFPNKGNLQLFVYLMTVQYAISQMYQISTAVSMEAAFKKAAENNISIPYTKEENEQKLSAYERRRRYMLETVSAPDAGTTAVETYFNLVKDSTAWGIDVKTPDALGCCFDLSQAFFSSIQSRSEAEILQNYEEYSQLIALEIQGLQKIISDSMCAPDLFSSGFRFMKDVSKAPSQILKDGLGTPPTIANLG